MSHGAGEAVQLRDHKHVPRAEVVEGAGKLLPFPHVHRRHLLDIDPLAPRRR